MGGTYRIEFAETIGTDAVWTPLISITVTNASQTIPGISNRNTRQQFYRATSVR
jgi:hypothetical protein